MGRQTADGLPTLFYLTITRQAIPAEQLPVFKNMSQLTSKTSLVNQQDFYIFIFKYFPVGELPKLVSNRTQNDYV